MTTISIDDIQRDLAGYLQRVKAGETLVILEANQPVAQIKPIEIDSAGLRPFGLCAGEFSVPEDFDTALPDEILEQFEGS